MIDLIGKRILVTGGHGFLGAQVRKELEKIGCMSVFAPSHKEADLTKEADIKRVLEDNKPNIIIHLAAAVGGIGANKDLPGEFFYKNLMMGVQLMEQARVHQIEKFVAIGTICCYPKITKIPFREEDLWNGYPDEVTGYYGLAKKMLLVQSEAYRKQYGFSSIFLMPVNVYGPGDNFIGEHAHVIPALVKKFVDAKEEKQQEVICWGTGNVSREFIYVEDCARAIVMATQRYDRSYPVNIGTGKELLIRDLADIIAKEVGFHGKIVWDLTKPDGQPRRCLDVSKAYEYFGFKAQIDFKEGIQKTIDWYISTKGKRRERREE